MTEAPVRVRSVCLRNFLSVSGTSQPFELGPLTVLIGPNGSGTSTRLEAFAVLRAGATGATAEMLSAGGGVGGCASEQDVIGHVPDEECGIARQHEVLRDRCRRYGADGRHAEELDRHAAGVALSIVLQTGRAN